MSKLCFIHFSEHINVSIKTIVLQCIISMYAIMHDKDFVYQLLSSGSCLKVTTWQIMAVVSNRKSNVSGDLYIEESIEPNKKIRRN